MPLEKPASTSVKKNFDNRFAKERGAVIQQKPKAKPTHKKPAHRP
jgi:hypothetical protein